MKLERYYDAVDVLDRVLHGMLFPNYLEAQVLRLQATNALLQTNEQSLVQLHARVQSLRRDFVQSYNRAQDVLLLLNSSNNNSVSPSSPTSPLMLLQEQSPAPLFSSMSAYSPTGRMSHKTSSRGSLVVVVEEEKGLDRATLSKQMHEMEERFHELHEGDDNDNDNDAAITELPDGVATLLGRKHMDPNQAIQALWEHIQQQQEQQEDQEKQIQATQVIEQMENQNQKQEQEQMESQKQKQPFDEPVEIEIQQNEKVETQQNRKHQQDETVKINQQHEEQKQQGQNDHEQKVEKAKDKQQEQYVVEQEEQSKAPIVI
eukprot:CAMPEP_0118694656 /NCGR_PEP_ID=MMETSP0800-20121206/12674_1 /TAXON_ID=210618 ORGANISM="Striatella unipunctata, Strain CCMP2910" /NCGR_SAMPLE_ID=MMETSP0800 /ASSEMBLY_ACC=CAM_ASM_000638 /LENGTH=316 /DNA_ID=CAMNT_0006593205 /DNA_START=213 /DNA_END=1163 /DNA_ORIENTATION=-